MGRKTVDLKALVERVNEMLKDSTCSPEVREGMCQVVETALHSSNNYGGFAYLRKCDGVAYGHPVGINSNDQGCTADLSYEEKFADTDDTRRRYFTGQI